MRKKLKSGDGKDQTLLLTEKIYNDTTLLYSIVVKIKKWDLGKDLSSLYNWITKDVQIKEKMLVYRTRGRVSDIQYFLESTKRKV